MQPGLEMHMKTARLLKPLRAHVTFERPLRAVFPTVPCQKALDCKASTADRAEERLVRGMHHSHV